MFHHACNTQTTHCAGFQKTAWDKKSGLLGLIHSFNPLCIFKDSAPVQSTVTPALLGVSSLFPQVNTGF